MSGPDGVAGDRLRSFVERIERIDEDLKAMNDEKKDVFAEVKSEGFDVKILKEVIRLRKQDQNERDERVRYSTSTFTQLRRRQPQRHRLPSNLNPSAFKFSQRRQVSD